MLEPATNGQTTATVFGLPSFKVTAKDRQTALDQIQQLIKQWLANAEVVSVSIPTIEDNSNPWLKFGGIFKNDADFEAIVQAIEQEREETTTPNTVNTALESLKFDDAESTTTS